MKVPHSSKKLAKKRAILEATISEPDLNIRRYHSILGTSKQNLVATMERIHSILGYEPFQCQVPTRKTREGGIPELVKAAAIQWWSEETMVSPNTKDICRKWLGRNLYDAHPAHLLLESQVLIYSTQCSSNAHKFHIVLFYWSRLL
jgi:hypothetical protein